MDISKLIQEGRVYLRKKFDEIHVYDASTNEEILVYAVRNGTHITYDKVVDPATKKISWIDPTGRPVPALIEASQVAYSEDLISTLVERMVEGEALTRICKDPTMPRYSQLMRWIKLHPWIRQAIEDARLARAEHHIDRVLQEAEVAESSKDPIEATKVKIQAHQWLAGVSDPRYSSKNKIEANINMPTQIIVQTGIDRSHQIAQETPRPVEALPETRDGGEE